jgi:hypothetical protein
MHSPSGAADRASALTGGVAYATLQAFHRIRPLIVTRKVLLPNHTVCCRDSRAMDGRVRCCFFACEPLPLLCTTTEFDNRRLIVVLQL